MRTARGAQHHQRERVAMPLAVEIPVPFAKQLLRFGERRVAFGVEREQLVDPCLRVTRLRIGGVIFDLPEPRFVDLARCLERSEEHTSELQSLMRISYAVFCLKKKNNERTINSITH